MKLWYKEIPSVALLRMEAYNCFGRHGGSEHLCNHHVLNYNCYYYVTNGSSLYHWFVMLIAWLESSNFWCILSIVPAVSLLILCIVLQVDEGITCCCIISIFGRADANSVDYRFEPRLHWYSTENVRGHWPFYLTHGHVTWANQRQVNDGSMWSSWSSRDQNEWKWGAKINTDGLSWAIVIILKKMRRMCMYSCFIRG